MSKGKKSKFRFNWQVTALIILLLLLMVTSVATSMVAMGIINIFPGESGESISSMTDAQIRCDNEIRQVHGQKVRSFMVDDLSSHYDYDSGRYKLYYELDFHRSPSKSTGVTKFYMNCFVTATGRIRNMELYEEKSFTPKAVRRTKGNAFGM